MPGWRRFAVWLGLALLAVFAGCGQPESAGEPGAKGWRLAEVAQIEADGRFLVSPAWLPDGRLLARGSGGVGLFQIPADQGPARALDPELPGPLVVGRDGLVALFRSPQRLVRWMPYDGRLQIEQADSVEVLAERDAWGVSVSPDGELVAWCMDHLPVAELRVIDGLGRLRYRGPGAQPAWHPDGRRLVFVQPQSRPGPDGRRLLVGGQVILLDLDDGRSYELTSGSEAFDMQPVVSFDGGQLAWSDWRSGRVVRARLLSPGVEP